MEEYLLPAIIAAAVCLLGWWGVMLTKKLSSGEQRKIKQRLNNEDAGAAPLRPAAAAGLTLTDAVQVPEFLARKAFIQTLRKKLSLAFPDMTLQRFLLIEGACVTAPIVLSMVMGWNLLVSLVLTAVMAYVPILVLNMRRSRRQRTVSEQLPEAMDFLSRVLRAGHSLSTGIQMMSEELPAPLSVEFRKCYDQHSLGQPLEEGLREMVPRVDSTDFSFFVTAVLIQRQTGGDLSEVLSNISGMVRQRGRLAQQVKAKTAEGRFTGYIMVAFPAVMFCLCYYLNPDLYGLFFASSTGWMMLGTAVFLQVLGLFMIKKITTLTV